MKFQLIIDSIEKCIIDGINIEAGACFDWVHGTWPNQFVNDQPRAVNWAGAILWMNGGNDYSFNNLLNLIDMTQFEFYMFTIGFDRGMIISIINDDLKEIGQDKTSIAAYKLRKKYLK